MNLLVVSDTHGDVSLLHEIVSRNRANTDIVIHLGDNLKDLETVMCDFPLIASLGVLGNCDYPFMYQNPKNEGTFTADGKNIFYTHGHKYNVNFGEEYLISNAAYNKADIVLYGHTHVGVCREHNGMLIVNPGSLSRPRDGSGGSYVRLYITESGVKCKILGVEE